LFKKVLIANRGEIACRVIKTLQRLGIRSVAIYSDVDIQSRHVLLADEAYAIGGKTAQESYLNIAAIIEVAKCSGADAVHPGYGFLSENPAFARALADAGIVFIGPSVAAMESMASKQTAKQCLESSGVPLVPGYHGVDQRDETLLEAAELIGFPVLLKPAAGGGGKGMRVVDSAHALPSALAGARREALRSFGDETLMIEKYLFNPRHIEVQLLADTKGHVLHLGERDCSVQRRHQKIIEEAPAPGLLEALRQAICKAAVDVAKAIRYTNAGTVEFLVDATQQFYFIEMNTRLQVEHPVTECVTGIDLVEWQCRIAAGEPLTMQQKDIVSQGHAIECRLYAEDPRHDFLPASGLLTLLHTPVGEGVRLDTGVCGGDFITTYYDPMIAKLTTWGATRDEAMGRMRQALDAYAIGGIKTNLFFLKSLLASAVFAKGDIHTRFLDETPWVFSEVDALTALKAVVCYDYLQMHATLRGFFAETCGWTLQGTQGFFATYALQDMTYTVYVRPVSNNALQMTDCCDGTLYTLQGLSITHETVFWHDGVMRMRAVLESTGVKVRVHLAEGVLLVSRGRPDLSDAPLAVGYSGVIAPMPASVIAVLKNKGSHVKAGEPLVILEAMKMEHTLFAPYDGVLTDIFYDIGAQVVEGARLVELIEDM